jgi:acyl-CoA thioesterase I
MEPLRTQSAARRAVMRLLASGPFGGLLAHLGARAGAAQEGQPAGPEGAAVADPVTADLVQSVHPEKVYGYLPGFGRPTGDATLAALYGLDAETYGAIRGRLDANARAAAQELLADPDLAARVDRLPFAAGTTVVGIGESDMDDLQSWLEILRHLLELRRPGDRIRVVNAAVSGQTTTQALRSIIPVLAQQPAWILCAFGGNDSVRYGAEPTEPQVSPEETARNLAGLRRQGAAQTGSRWVWVTRWVPDEARVAAFPPFRRAQFALRAADFEAVSDLIRRQAPPGDPVVDLREAIGRPPDPALLVGDGLHPSLAGHRAIARLLVERLTA